MSKTVKEAVMAVYKNSSFVMAPDRFCEKCKEKTTWATMNGVTDCVMCGTIAIVKVGELFTDENTLKEVKESTAFDKDNAKRVEWFKKHRDTLRHTLVDVKKFAIEEIKMTGVRTMSMADPECPIEIAIVVRDQCPVWEKEAIAKQLVDFYGMYAWSRRSEKEGTVVLVDKLGTSISAFSEGDLKRVEVSVLTVSEEAASSKAFEEATQGWKDQKKYMYIKLFAKAREESDTEALKVLSSMIGKKN